MLVTMTLSDVLNNVATALIAAPIALDVAQQLGVSPDPFLMAVAVAASCAFLTPIGHKNNTLIMGPGRIPVWRLLAHGPATGAIGGGHIASHDSPRLATLITADTIANPADPRPVVATRP